MESDKKPGSRDGKPLKGTRRKVKAVLNRADTVVIEGQKTGERDAETGMAIGLEYSLNRDKRWEMVEEMRKDDDVMVHDTLVTNSTKTRQSAMAKKNALAKAKVDKAKKKAEKAAAGSGDSGDSEETDKEGEEEEEEEKEGEEEEDSKVQVVKTRKGPKVKTNVPKKEKEDEAWKKEEFEKTVVVVHMLSDKESNKVKNIVCRSNTSISCRCDYCIPQKMRKGLGNKVQKQLQEQGL